jgi:hypothetical protein
MSWVKHVACIGVYKNWLENLKETGHFENPGIDGWIILKWISKKENGKVWTEFMWLTIRTGGTRRKKKPEKELWTECWLYEGTFDTRKIPRITHSMPGLFCLMADSAVSATVTDCYEPATTYFSSTTVTSIFHASTFQDVATWLLSVWKSHWQCS